MVSADAVRAAERTILDQIRRVRAAFGGGS
jgi:hypothetical protein